MESIINWDDVSYIVRSKHKANILKVLGKPKTPTKVKEETGLHFNSVSRILVELEKKKFIKCLNPTQKLARFYLITNEGKRLLKEIEEF